ncbi:unnamed protein product [Cochlearia groenlandica]
MAETTLTVVATKHNGVDPYIKILQNRPNDIDISFSSYLKPDNNNNNNNEQQQKEPEDNEISIFEAKRYFSESGSNNDRNGPRFSSVSSAKVSSFTTASSEASWNSQTGLLCNNNRQEPNRDGRGNSKKSGHKWFFRRRTCPCSSSKSVQVKETKPRIVDPRTGSDRIVSSQIVHHHQTISIDQTVNRESKAHVSNFSFPTLYEASKSSEKTKNPVLSPIKPVLTPNKPVFTPIKPGLNQIEPVLHPASPKGVIVDEEATSDASSDLFEIESFSTQPAVRAWVPPPARNSIDETETECGYEPSEASVTWSVTTAEPAASAVAANFSRIGLSSTSLAFNGCDKKRTGLFICRCEKAVMVNGEHRLVQPLKSVGDHDEIAEKVLCNNGSSKLCLTSRTMS